MNSKSRIRKKVLIAEDDLNLSKLYKNILETSFDDLDITLAKNGMEAYQYILDKEFDLIISDQQMPRLKGSDLIIKTKTQKLSKNRNTPVIFLSAYILDVKKATNQYTDIIYLTKPFRPKSLISNTKMLLLGQSHKSEEKLFAC